MDQMYVEEKVYIVASCSQALVVTAATAPTLRAAMLLRRMSLKSG
jgi:hypothetical protein